MGISMLLVSLILLVLGSIPAWSYSREWGYVPSSIFGTMLLVSMSLVLLGLL